MKIDIIHKDVGSSTMPEIVEEATKDLKAWKVKVPRGQAPAFLEKTVNAALSSGGQVLVMRADMVFGIDHLRSALFHAKKAIEERRNSSDSLTMESLLYASGERQLSSAVRKMSVDMDTEEIVVAKLSEGALETESSWRALDDSTNEASVIRLKSFGITQNELESVGDGDPMELILEKVAAVDIIKK